MVGSNVERNQGRSDDELNMSPEVDSEGALLLMAAVLGKEEPAVEVTEEEDQEVVRQRLIELGVLAEGTPISLSEQRKPYLGQ